MIVITYYIIFTTFKFTTKWTQKELILLLKNNYHFNKDSTFLFQTKIQLKWWKLILWKNLKIIKKHQVTKNKSWIILFLNHFYIIQLKFKRKFYKIILKIKWLKITSILNMKFMKINRKTFKKQDRNKRLKKIKMTIIL
jgi:hypothetical protein